MNHELNFSDSEKSPHRKEISYDPITLTVHVQRKSAQIT